MNKETVLITGASGGIGYELSKIFARDKYDLILIARNIEKLNEIKETWIEEYGIHVHVIGKDLTRKDAPLEIYEELQEKKINVDILINNAGFGVYGEYVSTKWENHYDLVQVNVTALIHMTRLFLPAMIEKGKGKVMNVASTASFLPGPFLSTYYASKSFVLSFSEAISVEVKNTGVTVNTLCPGPTKTGFEDRATLGKSKLFQTLKVADATAVAEYGYKMMMKEKVISVHGASNRLLILGAKLAPRWLVRKIMYHIQKNRLE